MSALNPVYNAFNFCVMEDRLETYKNWPFGDDALCSAHKMAEAGFYQPNPHEEPDLAKCFVCSKELDGWEKNDDPLKEHEKHQNTCEFIKLNKKSYEITLEQLYNLLQASVRREMEKINHEKEKKMEQEFNQLTNVLDKKWKRRK